jgi:hypothetical protein
MLYFALAESALLFLVTNLAARKGPGPGTVLLAWTWLALSLAPLCLGAFYPVGVLNALLVALVATCCCGTGPGGRRLFMTGSLTVTVVSYVGVGVYAFFETRQRLAEPRGVPLAERLDYEARGRERALARAGAAEMRSERLTAAVEAEIDQDSEARARTEEIRRLHEDHVQAFIDSPGFGMRRRVRMYSLLRPPRPDPVRLEPIPDVAPEEPGDSAERLRVLPPEPGLWDLHRGSVIEFANALGFGLVTRDRRLIGFQEHHFRKAPRPVASVDGCFRWRVVQLDLVSLLRHDPPAVYLSEELPAMEFVSHFPTRPLDRFEADSLTDLRRGEDLVIRSDGGDLRLLGAIRAGRQCLDCHAAERGDLLGAFSYRLRRGPA